MRAKRGAGLWEGAWRTGRGVQGTARVVIRGKGLATQRRKHKKSDKKVFNIFQNFKKKYAAGSGVGGWGVCVRYFGQNSLQIGIEHF